MTFEEKTIDSEIIYKGAILNLRRDKVVTKSGKTGFREIIEHNGGSVVVALKDDGKIIMVKQYRKALECDVLELPAGKLEKGEDPEAAVIRELKEETGYRAGKVKFMTEFLPSVGYTGEKLYLYIATDLEPGEPSFDEDEAIEIVEVDLDEAVNMVVDGRITDGKSMVGILLTKYHI